MWKKANGRRYECEYVLNVYTYATNCNLENGFNKPEKQERTTCAKFCYREEKGQWKTIIRGTEVLPFSLKKPF